MLPLLLLTVLSVTQADSNTTPIDTDRSTIPVSKCMLAPVDQYISSKIEHHLRTERVSLIEYQLNLSNYSVNPLKGTNTIAYKLDKWSRVTTSQGQTLLSLAFNYGVLSMATLTLGTKPMDVDLVDHPPGCMGTATEEEKIKSIIYLLVRDFQNTTEPTLKDEARICHEVILPDNGYAIFRDRCYYKHPDTKEIVPDDNIENVWLTLLYVLLFIVRYSLMFFGPYLFISYIERMSTEQIPYVVKSKDALEKTVLISPRRSASKDVKPKHTVDLTGLKGYPELMLFVNNNPQLVDKPIKVKFPEYHIKVNYRRLLTENTVEVGLLKSLYDAIFQCNIRTKGPFENCCRTNMFHSCPSTKRKLPWIKFWRKVAKASMVLLVPIPYYIRLIVYYLCEHEEMQLRKSFIEKAGLREKYETTSSLMQHLTPTHPLFITIYAIYAVMAIFLAALPKEKREGRLLKIIVGSFRDLKTLSFTDTLSMVVSNVIWPFQRFGMLGCLVCFIYWPIAIPVTLIVGAIYTIPTLYLTMRMAFYSRSAIFERLRRRKGKRLYQLNPKTDKGMYRFETVQLLGKEETASAEKASQEQLDDIALDELDNINSNGPLDTISYVSSIVYYPKTSWRRFASYVFIAVLCIATLYGVMIILSEVIGCLVEVVVFTIMGVIVNAADLLKYVMLALMIFVYCCDCFNNVEKKYIKLNKALFGEIKGRIKNLSDITSLPSTLQMNQGFKAQELNEQASYEKPDGIADRPRNHWTINDLCLFVDSEDMPRIPKMLFDMVCQIRVAGVPGPVYRGLIEATQQLLKIIIFIVFVFIVVLTFGSVYKVSPTNQMLATMVGGFLPMVLKTFMSPPSPDIELGTVSFKSKLDEVIKNFYQTWPIYDLPFDLVKDEPETEEKKKDEVPDAAAAAVAPAAAGFANGHDPVIIGIPFDDSHDMSTNECVNDTSNVQLVPFPGRVVPKMSESNNNGVPLENGRRDSFRSDLTGEKTKMTRFADVNGLPETEVDILIYLPSKYDEVWLDEWSDMASLHQ